jgi:hypothetical protein
MLCSGFKLTTNLATTVFINLHMVYVSEILNPITDPDLYCND